MSTLDAPTWTPAVQDVANYILARTRLPNGTLAGTFNTQTNPTDAMVNLIIAQQVSLIAPKLGDVPDALADSARALLALKSAIAVEESYFMEQVSAGNSPHESLCKEYTTAFQAWLDAAEGNTPNAYHTDSLPIGTLYPGYATGTY